MTAPAAIILDCEGTALSREERALFGRANPYAFILFKRNCENPAQVRALIAELRDAVGRDAPILIDQEGGRVARLKPPHWRACPAAGRLAALPNAAEAIYLNARLMAAELRDLGISVDCAPVADLLIAGAHDIIGDRAYGSTPERVAQLAGEMARGLMEGGVVPVVKHTPGHGRARADSHHELPVVETSLAELRHIDFAAFRTLNTLPMAMTAHVVYTALDADRPATLSPEVIRVIREEIGFDGLLMSDEITMKALSGSIESRALAALAAGCDVVMYCNGIVTLGLEEKRAVIETVGPISAAAERRHERAFAQVRDAEAAAKPLDMPRAEAQLAAMLAQAA